MRKVLRMLSLADREMLNEDERAELAAQLLRNMRASKAAVRRFLWALDAQTAGMVAEECAEPEGVPS